MTQDLQWENPLNNKAVEKKGITMKATTIITEATEMDMSLVSELFQEIKEKKACIYKGTSKKAIFLDGTSEDRAPQAMTITRGNTVIIIPAKYMKKNGLLSRAGKKYLENISC